MRRTYIFLLLALLLVLSTVGYFIFKIKRAPLVSDSAPLEPINTPTSTGVELVGAPLSPILSHQVLDFWIYNEGVFSLDFRGWIFKNNEPVFETKLSTVHAAYSSYNGRYALFLYDYPLNPSFVLFDSEEGAWAALPRDIVSAAWSPNDNRLLYTDGTSIFIFNPSTGKSESVVRLETAKISLAWHHPEEVAFWSPSSPLSTGSLYSLDLKSKRVRELLFGAPHFEVLWSSSLPVGFVVFGGDVAHPQLMNTKGEVQSVVSLILLPEKCIFEENFLYCATPYSHASEEFSLDQYQKQGLYTLDRLVRINLGVITSPKIEEVSLPSGALIDAVGLRVANGALYFKNRYDNFLYGVDLPVESSN